MDLAVVAWIPLTISSLLAGCIALIKFAYLRGWVWLLSAVTYIFLAAGFALLALSAHYGTNGMLDRATMAVYIRSFIFVGGLMRCVLVVSQSGVSIRRSK